MKVGEAFKQVLGELGIHPKPECKCHEIMAEMDVLGPDGVRREFPRLKGEVQANLKNYGWGERLWAAAVMPVGMAVQINPFDPIGSLMKMAISRAEQPSPAPKPANG